MAIQTQKFTPLQHRHYQLAETQSEKDAAMQRQMQLQAQQNAHRESMANLDAANQGQQFNAQMLQRQSENQQAQQNKQFEQGLSLADRDRRAAIDAQELERQGMLDKQNMAQTERSNRLADAKESRAAETHKLSKEDRATNKYFQERTMALGDLGTFLGMHEPDESGKVDITPTKKSLEIMFGSLPFRKIYAQFDQEGNHVSLVGEKNDTTTVPISSGGSPVNLRSDVLMQSSLLKNKNDEPKSSFQKIKQTVFDEKGLPIGEEEVAVAFNPADSSVKRLGSGREIGLEDTRQRIIEKQIFNPTETPSTTEPVKPTEAAKQKEPPKQPEPKKTREQIIEEIKALDPNFEDETKSRTRRGLSAARPYSEDELSRMLTMLKIKGTLQNAPRSAGRNR
jgi:hypothetical protein